jgi:hypothetical protein
MTLPPFVAIAMAELRRHCCRVNHGDKDIARCPRCVALAGWDAWRAIVQEAGVPVAEVALVPEVPACKTCGGRGGSGYATTGHLAWDRCPDCHLLPLAPPLDVLEVAEIMAVLRKLKIWPGYLNAGERVEFFDRTIALLSTLCGEQKGGEDE